MKKIIAFMLIAILCVSLCSCNKNSNKSLTSDSSSNKINETFDEFVYDPPKQIYEDEFVKIIVTSLTSEIKNPDNEHYRFTEYKINYSVTNKTDDCDISVVINIGDGYVGPHAVSFASGGGSTMPGKINDNLFWSAIYSERGAVTSKTDGAEDIKSVDDLKLFNARIHIDLTKDNFIVKNYSTNVSLD